MTPERESTIKQLKFFNKLNFGFFISDVVVCLLCCWAKMTNKAIVCLGFGIIYIIMIKVTDWFIGKLEKKDDKNGKQR